MQLLLDAGLVAVDGVVIVLVITSTGIILTNLKVLNSESGEILSKITVVLLLPCLLFCEIMNNLTIHSLEYFCIILIYSVLHVAIGCGLGWLLGRLVKAPSNTRSLMKATIAFQNTTAIPLVYASVLGDSAMPGMESNFSDEATEYVLIYTVFSIILKWTVAYKILDKDPYYLSIRNPGSMITENGLNDLPSTALDSPRNPTRCTRFLAQLKQIMNPPIYASIIAIPLALFPYVKECVFVGPQSILGKNVFAALRILGKTASPLIDIVLGINLSGGCPRNANINRTQLTAIVFGKLLLMPIIGFGLIEFAYRIQLIVSSSQNRILAVILLVIYSSPTSLQLLMVCMIHENNMENISKLYITIYIVAIFSMTLWTTVFLLIYY